MKMDNSHSFPTSLADLNFQDPLSISHNLYNAIADLKRSTLSISNRLHSIAEDSAFVQQVASECEFPLVANERCGSWYVPSDQKAASAYFKSTDGHTGQWSFSLRRLNLQLLPLVGRNEG